MDLPSTETKREIVKLVFPGLRYGGDPEIEKYFELRKGGKLAQALAIYNGALRVRYPDDSARVLLLRLYRENSPRYSSFQESLILDFASSLAARIRSNIDLIVTPLERADLSDALRALKAVESVLSRLPGETETALELLIRYDRFARVLGHREVLVGRALELVREYDAVSRADDPHEYDFIARSEAIEARRRAASGRPPKSTAQEESLDFVSRSANLERRRKSAEASAHNYFDPDRIKFSEADKARVEISPALTRREDRVLAFCAKYWPLARDNAFERIVFLYSRKFGGRHFEIFRAIKLGRARGATDDEILSAVSAILTTSYSYSVSGDLYMQIMWRRLRARMDAREVAERLAAPGPESRVRSRGKPADAAAPEPRTRLPAPIAPAPKAATTPIKAPSSTVTKASAISTPRQPSHVAALPEKTPVQKTAERPQTPGVKPVASMSNSRPPPPRTRDLKLETDRVPAEKATLLRPAVKAKSGRLLEPAPVGPEPVLEIRSTRGSISDSIRSLSGKTYDVYKEIFLEKVRDHIHRTLLTSQTRSHGLFDTATNEAEDQVYGFITAHYDDPFMDWEHSAEREAVEARGFAMPSLLPIIKSCFKKL